VYDKSGLVEFATVLHNSGVILVSTGGTYKILADIAGIPVNKVSEVANFPEILDGRVKTLHPKIHGGILARRDHRSDMDELREHNILPFDIVINNLYPFQAIASNSSSTFDGLLW
jgi:phosphoribosylaminoimidazolecarboxamide formyltransferase/IMP cyclohydrolase